jgi:hypothetical protein
LLPDQLKNFLAAADVVVERGGVDPEVLAQSRDGERPSLVYQVKGRIDDHRP